MTAQYPSKVQAVLDRIERANQRAEADGLTTFAWQQVTVEQRPPTEPGDHSTLWIVRAERPGNVYTEQRLSVYVATRTAYTIPGTDLRMRATQRLQGGRISRFGGDVQLRTWRELARVNP